MRNVLRESAFEKSAEKLFGSVRIADDELEHLDWYFAREELSVLEGCPRWPTTVPGLVLRSYKSKCGAVVVFEVEDGAHRIIMHDVYRAVPASVVPIKTGSR